MINLIPKYATGCSPLACVQTSAVSFVVQETSARRLFPLGLPISNYKKLIVYNKRRRKNDFLKKYCFVFRELPKPTEKKSAPPPAPKPKPTSKSGQLIK